MNSALAAAVYRLALWNPDRGRPDRERAWNLGVRARRRSAGQLHVNGAWLAHRSTSAGRYAAKMLRALASIERVDLILHVPADADVAISAWTGVNHIEIRRSMFSGRVFEQVYLPAATAGEVLLTFEGGAPILKRRQLVTMHDAAPFRRPSGFSRSYLLLHTLTYRWLARTADGVLTGSVYSAHELADVLRVDVDRFIVAGGAADSLNDVEPVRPALPVHRDYHLVIGTAAPHENIAVAAATMAGSGRRVVIVGMNGSELAVNPSVVCAEQVTDAELVWLYRRCQALVLPTSYAGFGLSVLEAQAMGCPVVCADSAALPEVCGDSALYFDPDDPEMLTTQLDRIDREVGLVEDLRGRAFLNAGRYSWDGSAGKVIDWVERTYHRRVAVAACRPTTVSSG